MRSEAKTWTLGTGETIEKIRLYADEGKALTNNGEDFFHCVDVDTAEGWQEVDDPGDEEEATEEDYENALERFGVNA